MDREAEDKKIYATLRRRVNRARKFPTHTCPASRHLHTMALDVGSGRGYPMLQEEPVHCAITLLSVLASLWEARIEIAKLRERAKTSPRRRDVNER